jgi:serine/threonine protein kinase/Flp pilus assembly protein TadD
LLNGLSEPLPSPEDLQLGQALEEFLAAQEAGQKPNRKEFCARFPEIAGRLAECLAGLDFVNAAARELDPCDPVPAPAAAGLAGGTRLGDYHLLREVGRGGMGIVYEAEQISLGRRVALKVLPLATALDPRHLQRFKNEAQAAACLHHPHIVPVYAVGSEGGVHYYAMQFIDGQTLAAAIRDLRLGAGLAEAGQPVSVAWPPDTPLPGPGPRQATARPASPTGVHTGSEARSTAILSSDGSRRSSAFFRSAARLALQAAEALEHAHQQGVVHRDVKPANLLVDAGGHLWMTDFGLAFFQADGGLTQSGAVLGTLRYMSPEQALAKRGVVDHRTDIYSLGVTLYELLTLEVAFPGNERNELIRQVTQDDPRRPRRINPAIPHDLETIVLKAMAKEPEGRYATAQEMADDLGRFLGDEPIRARRAPFSQLFTKWVRRHPALVRSAAVLTVMAVVSLAVCTFLIWKAQREAEGQRVLAVRNLGLAREAVDEIYGKIDLWLAHVPQTELVQQQFLRKALQFYKQFAQETADSPTVRQKKAKTHQRIGEIHMRLGDLRASQREWDQARQLLDHLVAEFPRVPAYRQEHANCFVAQGLLHQAAGRPRRAEQDLRRARGIFQELCTLHPTDVICHLQLAACDNHLGMLLRSARRLREADQAFSRSLDLSRKLVVAAPQYRDMPSTVAKVSNNRANLLLDRIRELRAGRADWPVWATAAVGASACPGLSRSVAAAGLAASPRAEMAVYEGEAERCYRRATRILTRIVADHPTYADWRYDLGIAYHNLGWLFQHTGRQGQTAAEYRRARSHLERLVEEFPNISQYPNTLGGVLYHWAILLRDRGDQAGARPLLQRAVALHQAGVRALPTDADYRQRLWDDYQALTETLTALGDHPGAARVAQEWARFDAGRWQETLGAAQVLVRCIELARDDPTPGSSGHGAAVERYREAARKLLGQAVQNSGKDPAGQQAVAWFLIVCPDRPLRDAHRAVELARRAAEARPRGGLFWKTLGAAYYRLGDWKGAAAAIERGTALAGGKQDAHGFFQAMAYYRLGDPEQAARSYRKALHSVKDRWKDEQIRGLCREAAAVLGQPAPKPPANETARSNRFAGTLASTASDGTSCPVAGAPGSCPRDGTPTRKPPLQGGRAQCETAAAAFSPSGSRSAKRDRANGLSTGGTLPVAINSATRSPAAGPALNPYVPQPTSRRKPSTPSTRPMMGAKSGGMSHRPAHCRSTLTRASHGNSSSVWAAAFSRKRSVERML